MKTIFYSLKKRIYTHLLLNNFLFSGLTLGHLQAIIRKRLKLKPTMALFFLVNNNLAVAVTKNMTEIYNEL
ncbi:hypothetical protein, partial [Streptomyces sp. CHB19.2]|uniref:hypothetical protein n=1 Tax=Streptomyces sp. CHB19.2 TaxID=2841671 RepID=UPI002095F2A4